jgi:hypothetical protein
MLVTPYCKRIRPGRRTTRGRGFPFMFSPLCSVSRRPIWAGTRNDNLLVGPGTPPPRGRNADTDRPLKCSGPSGDVTDRPHLGTGLSAMHSMGSRACPLVCACPPVSEVVMVTFGVYPPSGVFSTTTFLQEILLFPSASRALPMMTSLSLPLSVVLG